MALGHLGHLGHGFKLQAGASGWLALGHLGHCFLRDPNDLKAWIWRARSFKALGHLGHFVTLQKSAPDEVSAPPYSHIGINPYIKIVNFVFCIS
jgi:hypothetical protein